MTKRRNQFNELVDHFKAHIGVRHFPATKFKGDLHLHVFAKKINRMVDFDTQVMGVNARAELNLFDGGSMLVLPGFFFLLGDFVAVFAEIHQAAHRGNGVGGNFHQIHPMLASEINRVGE